MSTDLRNHEPSVEFVATSTQPMVSVVMPVFNEERYIEGSLGAVLAQDYPSEKIEILVADGMSTDNTRAMIREMQLDHPQLHLIDNPEKIVATGLNAAIARAQGDVIVRVDGHCDIDRHYVQRCVRHLQESDADGVGGPIDTIGETPLADVIAAAMSSPFGVGGSPFRTVRDKTMVVDTVAFPAYSKDVIQQAGPYDEELVRNQDDEYNYRLRKMGAKILLAADVKSRYYSRGSLRGLWRQYFQYGYWKVRVMQKHPRQMRPRQFAPACFVVGILASLVVAAFSVAGWWMVGTLLGTYALASSCASLLLARKQGWRMLPSLPLVFGILHISYGLGFLVGLATFWNRWKTPVAEKQSTLTTRWPHHKDDGLAQDSTSDFAEAASRNDLPNSPPTEHRVPYFRPAIGEAEIREVTDCLRSGWLTTGPRTGAFESQFAEAVGARHAVAANSCTAALHLAVEALGLKAGQAVLVPTLTFAATAEVIRYQGAMPVLVDCDPQTQNIDLSDAERKLRDVTSGELFGDRRYEVVGIIPVHVGGQMVDMDAVASFAHRHGLWIVEDAAHALPAAYRTSPDTSWRRCGENTASVTCFSFYANKTITTGEGGMAVTADRSLADRMRSMSLHGLSQDAWNRHSDGATWDYRIVAPGYKYNLTDLASSIGIHQLQRAESMRSERVEISDYYREALADVMQIELPCVLPDRVHSWHLFPIRLQLDKLSIDRDAFYQELRDRGVGCSVHWRPLHMHPYYEQTYEGQNCQLPVASEVWPRLISLPIFPGMTSGDRQHVAQTVRHVCSEFATDDSLVKKNNRKPR